MLSAPLYRIKNAFWTVVDISPRSESLRSVPFAFYYASHACLQTGLCALKERLCWSTEFGRRLSWQRGESSQSRLGHGCRRKGKEFLSTLAIAEPSFGDLNRNGAWEARNQNRNLSSSTFWFGEMVFVLTRYLMIHNWDVLWTNLLIERPCMMYAAHGLNPKIKDQIVPRTRGFE